jgi:hypothetical protein
MGETLRGVLVVVLLVTGVVMVCYAGYLQYASLPGEHTLRRGSRRAGLVLGGFALIVGGSRLA